jgi:hypothetical protein
MAVDFYFNDPTIELPPLARLQLVWAEVPDESLRQMIIAEHQYLHFHRFMLQRLYCTAPGRLAQKPWEQPLGLSVRAGAIKAMILLTSSIVEAALMSHAVERGYNLPAQVHRRTFGKVLEAWRVDDQPRPDVAGIWDDLRTLQSYRNHVHLKRAAEEPEARWQNLLENEQSLVRLCQRVLDHVAALKRIP